MNIGSEDERKWKFMGEAGFVEVSWLRTKRRQIDLWKPSQGHKFLPNPAGTTITFLHQRNQSYKILHLFSAYCWPEIIRLPDTSPGKMGLLAISRELQFRVCNHGDLCASPPKAREGEHVHREEKEVGRTGINTEPMAFQWLSPCWEKGVFLIPVGPYYCHRVWEHPLYYLKLRDHSCSKSFINSNCSHINNMKTLFLILKCFVICRWEKAGEVSRELWEKAGKQGLLGINIGDHHGGIGGDLYSSAIIWEEQ